MTADAMTLLGTLAMARGSTVPKTASQCHKHKPSQSGQTEVQLRLVSKGPAVMREWCEGGCGEVCFARCQGVMDYCFSDLKLK